MDKYYSADFLRRLRNKIPINAVICDLLNLDLRYDHQLLRFRCPLCGNFHTATNYKTNLARCFDCAKNFNPIDLVMTVAKCGFLDAIKILKKTVSTHSK